jgi:hypothetical protein
VVRILLVIAVAEDTDLLDILGFLVQIIDSLGELGIDLLPGLLYALMQVVRDAAWHSSVTIKQTLWVSVV